MIWLDGKKLAGKQADQLRQRATNLLHKKITPTLAVILVGDNPASKIYVHNKQKLCAEIGVNCKIIQLPATIAAKAIKDKIILLNNDKNIHGIILQLPLPDKLNANELIAYISPSKDVDGLHPLNIGLLASGEGIFIPATPKGILSLFKEYKISIVGKNVVIVGYGAVAGAPLSMLLAKAKATVVIAQDKTKGLNKLTKSADIVISAVGKPGLITGSMIKVGAVVVDVGITKKGKNWVGDIDTKTVAKKAACLTPVPGGVGPLTVSALLSNVILAAELSGRPASSATRNISGRGA
ncbi:bifunctional 5,10-methylenetetrahydrofolate dehydrogenase/5,10-methenyltetrahydrofolate cyclohydrolase [Patescibacteria group bacterium]|nr:bifunctional 5,10-methylenetetrahydrofolate dehydrogenase/5,10-methenyltetrahydrofolate cyclohydrolase [Patescibacteria group bacterium]